MISNIFDLAANLNLGVRGVIDAITSIPGIVVSFFDNGFQEFRGFLGV